MTDTAQERDWTPEDDIDHAASQLLSLPHEAHSMTEREIITNAVDMGEEILDALKRLRARQREDGDECAECGTIHDPDGLCELTEQAVDAAQREGEREPVAWRVRYRRIGRDWTWFRLHADKAKAVQDVEHLIQNYKSVSYAEAVPLYTEPPAKRELDEELERASREHEKTIRAMSEHLCDATRLSMGGTKWICTRPPNHGGRHGWRPKPRAAEPPADTEEGADG